MLCGVNPKIGGHIFLHYPFTLELWIPEQARLSLSSWSFFITSLSVIGCFAIPHKVKLNDEIVWSPHYMGGVAMNRIRGLFEQNLLYGVAWGSDIIIGHIMAISLPTP